MTTQEIHRGTMLAPDETVVWCGRPSWRGVVRDVVHLRAIAAYMTFLVLLDAYQAWAKSVPFEKALHDSVPLAVVFAIVFGNIMGIGWLIGHTTRYTITNRRVILSYGIAIPATLSLPFVRLRSVAIAINSDNTGDIPLALKPNEKIPYLKLWPHARPWMLSHPTPMLRCVPHAAVVAGLLTRAVTAAVEPKEASKIETEILAA